MPEWVKCRKQMFVFFFIVYDTDVRSQTSRRAWVNYLKLIVINSAGRLPSLMSA